MALVAFQPPVAIYREEQNFDWRVYALIALLDGMFWLGMLWFHRHDPIPMPRADRLAVELGFGLVCGMVLPALVVVGVLRMITEVAPTDVRVWFGWIPTYRRIVPIGSIQALEVVTFRPIADHHVWANRQGRDGMRLFSARGNHGVRLDLADGTRLIIGSQQPEELARAIERAMRPGV